MPFRKFTQFIAALVLGLVLTLSSYPAQSQEFPSFDNCFQEVNSYPRKQNLNRYSKRQVYCLFVVELIDGGVPKHLLFWRKFLILGVGFQEKIPCINLRRMQVNYSVFHVTEAHQNLVYQAFWC
jgi:hypothetical protein